MMAANKMKSNSIAAVIFGIGLFVVLYVLLRFGFGPMWVQYVGFIMATIFALFVKPFILYREINYSLRELLHCYWDCAKVLLLACFIIIPTLYLIEDGMLLTFIKGLMAFIVVGLASYICLERQTKMKLRSFILKKIQHVRQ